MCGIVAYFGGAGNHLTRVLTGMSAIVYRAPDSTGIGLYGDDSEPIRTRKSLGAVGELVDALIQNPAYPDLAAKLFCPDRFLAACGERIAWRRCLLQMQGFDDDAAGQEGQVSPSFDDLVALLPQQARRLYPGACGAPGPMTVFRSATPEALVALVEHLVQAYDLSPTVIHSLYRRAMKAALADCAAVKEAKVTPRDLLLLFDQVFESLSTSRSPSRLSETASLNPEIWDVLWLLMADLPLAVPADYDRDGVRGVFRLIDGALLSRIPNEPGLQERMNAVLVSLWPDSTSAFPLSWRHFYYLERAANFFGRAASAALHVLQQEVVIPAVAADPGSQSAAASVKPGITDALSLRLLTSPIIAHGRWALQSPVTVANCHPFWDETRQRAIAVNGQFDAGVENRTKSYLQQVAGFGFRSENSGEYFSLLWGYYFRILRQEQQRFEAIRIQTENQLTDLSIGSQAIDYQVYHQVHDQAEENLDEMAFVASVHRMMQHGGQIAVIGLSRVSPRRLYVAANNRPIFVVRRSDNHDVMVVSDINAAIGLFPQKLIYARCRKLLEELERCDEKIARMRSDGASQGEIDARRRQLERTEAALFADFSVEIFPLKDEGRFARIETVVRDGKVRREILLTDLRQQPIHDIEPIVTTLKPPQVRRDLYASLFVSHQCEIPDRLEDILRTYLPGGAAGPTLGLNDKLFRRRFGQRLQNLRRVVVVGCGTSCHVALIVRAIFRRYLTELETVSCSPMDFDLIARSMSPERDLVVMVSWSGTTAEMVELAKLLVRQNIVAVAVTEKKFADMALILAQSGGLLLCLSGEEVTVAAVKSTFCLAFSVAVLAVWVAHERQETAVAEKMATVLRRLPDQIRQLQQNKDMKAFCARMAATYADAVTCLVLDTVHHNGVAREAALKLEETSWTSVSRAMDFADLPDDLQDINKTRALVLVIATSRRGMPKALEAMQRLHDHGIDFIALSCDSRESGHVETFSRGQCFFLPKIKDAFQPFLDLVFHYELAYQYGISHGQTSEGFPRNRAKSVTVGRSRPVVTPSPQAAVSVLPIPTAIDAVCRDTCDAGLASRAIARPAGLYFEHLCKLAENPDWFARIGKKGGSGSLDPAMLARRLFEDLPPDGTLLLVAADRMAEMAAFSAAAEWKPFLPCGVRVERLTDLPGKILPQTLLLGCACRQPDLALLSRLLETAQVPAAWVGSTLEAALQSRFSDSAGFLQLPDLPEVVAPDALYLVLCRLLSGAWQARDPARGKILFDHLNLLPETVDNLLNDTCLQSDLENCLTANRTYTTAFYVGPPGGSGFFWEDAFNRIGRMVVAGHEFGQSVHGPIVSVDNRVGMKYVALEKRDAMTATHGAAAVARWERAYLDGSGVDEFTTVADLPAGLFPSPFFAEGRWYLPVLRDDYNTDQDNLIFLDATSNRHFNLALDELSVFGCRYARIAVMTQAASGRRPEIGALRVQPVSHFIKLPGVASLSGTIPEMLLPVARHVLAMAAADFSNPRNKCAQPSGSPAAR